METLQAPSITPDQIFNWQVDLINQLSTQTIQYIAIAIAIIMAFAGVFYFFTFRPYNKELKNQSRAIRDNKTDLLEKITKLKREIDDSVGDKLIDVKKDILKESLTNNELYDAKVREYIAKKSKAYSDLISLVKADFSKEINKLNSKIDKQLNSLENLDKALKDILSWKDKNDDNMLRIDMRLRFVETFKYSQESKRGSILVPLRSIKDVLGTKEEWTVKYWLDELKEQIGKVVLETEDKAAIIEVLNKLTGKYEVYKKEINDLISGDTKK